MRRWVALALIVLSQLFSWADDSSLEAAYSAYSRTNYDLSISLLDERSQNPKVMEFLGKNYYMLGFEKSSYFKKSTHFLEKAASLDPKNAQYYLWLGRAYGRRAETSIFFKAIGYAKKTRMFFEKAHELEPSNTEIMKDLFEYYLEAPNSLGLGGGEDKAELIGRKIILINAAEGERASALLSQKRKDFSAAKLHWLRAHQLEPKNAGILIDIARFFRERREYGEAERFLRKSDETALNSPAALLEYAALYIEIGKRQEAKELLLRYEDPSFTPLTPDDPPRVEAKKLLKKLDK